MLRATSLKVTPKARRFRGITKAARELGVDRTHLYRVLKGQRQSRALIRRYKALRAAAA
jgi:DNA-binding phage protein